MDGGGENNFIVLYIIMFGSCTLTRKWIDTIGNCFCNCICEVNDSIMHSHNILLKIYMYSKRGIIYFKSSCF